VSGSLSDRTQDPLEELVASVSLDGTADPGSDHDEVAEMVTQARLATLGMLVAGLAHEINTPLGAINSNHDVLRRALGKLQVILEDEVVEPHELEEVRRIVKAVDGILRVNDMAVERMTELVKSLRSFGRLDRAELDFADLHEGIDSTLAILAHELKGVAVAREFSEIPLVECQPHQLNQVFMNLILNARQATADGGSITVRTGAAGDRVTVAVADTGTGIAPDAMKKLFQPGFTTKGGRIGMGLGLVICRQIVERHGGRITVSSEFGTGTTFTVVLPLRQRVPAQGTDTSSTTGGSR
jgi:two-component system, NtrC family, sensor kinase